MGVTDEGIVGGLHEVVVDNNLFSEASYVKGVEHAFPVITVMNGSPFLHHAVS